MIGVDIVKVERFANILKDKMGFLERFFSEEENELFKERNFSPEVIAGNFAAKEAFFKSIKKPLGSIKLKDISVLRDGLGAPYFKFSHTYTTEGFELSISHEKEYAIAFVIKRDYENMG